MSLQETSNLMVKQITRSHFLGVFERTVTTTPYGKTVIQIPYGNASKPATLILLITGGC